MEAEQAFLRLREAITISFPYLGMPTCIPACYGMIGVVQRKGSEYASTRVLRSSTITEEDVRKGQELRARIYKGVGNSEIFGLMDIYFKDLCESWIFNLENYFTAFLTRRIRQSHAPLLLPGAI